MNRQHLQIRMSAEMRKELQDVSELLGLPASDIIRSALFFGLPALVAMNELQDEMMRRLVRKLKAEARLRQSG